MPVKKDIKNTEARVLIYLKQVPNFMKNLTKISLKLGIDYSYLIKTLNNMVSKGWVFKYKYVNKSFYDLTEHAPIEKAKESLGVEDTQFILELSSQAQLDKLLEKKEGEKTMATIHVCDLCGKDVAVPTALTKISFGDSVLAEACYNCQAKIKAAVMGAVQEARKNRVHATTQPSGQVEKPMPSPPASVPKTVSDETRTLPTTDVGVTKEDGKTDKEQAS